METTIESLLWLARESDTSDKGTATDLLPSVQNAIEQNRHLLAGKPVEISLEVESTPILSAPAGVFAIAVSNLIRNSCQFTTRGQIVVTLKQNQIEVSDAGVGIAADTIDEIVKPDVSSSSSTGFGFGLDIVNRLCSRFGWQLKIDCKQGHGTKTSLIFQEDYPGSDVKKAWTRPVW
ncbi:HAMP domain-containing histidine kinase [bacterium]|nr:HAMP domain-containing histidine kinase [bacterium]